MTKESDPSPVTNTIFLPLIFLPHCFVRYPWKRLRPSLQLFRGGDLEVTTTARRGSRGGICQCSLFFAEAAEGRPLWVPRKRELLRVPLHPRRKIRAYSRCNSKPVADETRWLEELLGNFRRMSSACFFRRIRARISANFHKWNLWGKAIYQSGGQGRANRPGEPLGWTDAGNRPGSAGTPRLTSFQSMGAEEPGRDVVRATTGELLRVPSTRPLIPRRHDTPVVLIDARGFFNSPTGTTVGQGSRKNEDRQSLGSRAG